MAEWIHIRYVIYLSQMTNLRHLFESYKRAMVRITIRTPDGDLSTGSAFHIGDGWLATAAHVVTSGTIEEAVSGYSQIQLELQEVITHSDDKVDVAFLKTDLDLSHYLHNHTIHGAPDGYIKTDHFTIGGHLDDWVGEELVLMKVLLMGYPPIPRSDRPVLVASEGEVNAVVDKYIGPHPHFVISCTARGGFSGGAVLSEHGFLLGILTESLVSGGQKTELGFTSAISVEPLLALLHQNNIYPGANEETIEALFNGADH